MNLVWKERLHCNMVSSLKKNSIFHQNKTKKWPWNKDGVSQRTAACPISVHRGKSCLGTAGRFPPRSPLKCMDNEELKSKNAIFRLQTMCLTVPGPANLRPLSTARLLTPFHTGSLEVVPNGHLLLVLIVQSLLSSLLDQSLQIADILLRGKRRGTGCGLRSRHEQAFRSSCNRKKIFIRGLNSGWIN